MAAEFILSPVEVITSNPYLPVQRMLTFRNPNEWKYLSTQMKVLITLKEVLTKPILLALLIPALACSLVLHCIVFAIVVLAGIAFKFNCLIIIVVPLMVLLVLLAIPIYVLYAMLVCPFCWIANAMHGNASTPSRNMLAACIYKILAEPNSLGKEWYVRWGELLKDSAVALENPMISNKVLMEKHGPAFWKMLFLNSNDWNSLWNGKFSKDILSEEERNIFWEKREEYDRIEREGGEENGDRKPGDAPADGVDPSSDQLENQFGCRTPMVLAQTDYGVQSGPGSGVEDVWGLPNLI
ncbi:MAG: hypothetical protein LBT98_02565 [Puniceicoccales bacterium]|nr:hypothetical protein [Puniceicoccales bacterium]